MFNNFLGFLGLFLILIYIYRLNNNIDLYQKKIYIKEENNKNNYLIELEKKRISNKFIDLELNFPVMSNRNIPTRICKYC